MKQDDGAYCTYNLLEINQHWRSPELHSWAQSQEGVVLQARALKCSYRCWTRKATEKAWQKLRRGDVATGPKKNGKLDISSDKFAPLSNGGSTSDVNEMQGQMAPEEEIVVEEEAVEASA